MKQILYAMLCVLTLTSCQKMLVNNYVQQNKTILPSTYTNGKKTIIFLSVAHVGKPEFYQSVKKNVDSLRAKGYKAFFEGLVLDYTKVDNVKMENYLRKFKKVTGIYISPYDNYDNKTLKVPKIKGAIIQTFENTGILPSVDTRADYDLITLVDKFEAKYGPIKLDNCDLNLPLNDIYKCSKIDEAKRDNMMLEMRNNYIVEKINNSGADKIVIVYGMRHESGVMKKLRIQDSTLKFIPQKAKRKH